MNELAQAEVLTEGSLLAWSASLEAGMLPREAVALLWRVFAQELNAVGLGVSQEPFEITVKTTAVVMAFWATEFTSGADLPITVRLEPDGPYMWRMSATGWRPPDAAGRHILDFPRRPRSDALASMRIRGVSQDGERFGYALHSNNARGERCGPEFLTDCSSFPRDFAELLSNELSA